MHITITLHLLAVLVWVGGMFFAYMALRPAAVEALEPPERLTLWVGVFARFFPWVWAAVVILPVTGYWMILYAFDGFAGARTYIHIMQGTGWLMIAIYAHVYFAPYQRLKAAVASKDWPAGGKALSQIRVLVAINLTLGILTSLIAASGAYWS